MATAAGGTVAGGTVAGVDGCRGGWLVVLATASPFAVTSVRVEPQVSALLAEVAAGRVATVAVDMPIGLSDDGPRPCDVAARAALGARRSSVFPAPARCVLAARDYDHALRLSRASIGRGLSKQTWNLVPRIAELDGALDDVDDDARHRIHEAHPELAFTVLSGAPMRHPKRTGEGRRERLAVLRHGVADRWLVPAAVPEGAAPDDVLDASVLALRAAQWLHGSPPPVVLGSGEVDPLGRRMEICG